MLAIAFDHVPNFVVTCIGPNRYGFGELLCRAAFVSQGIEHLAAGCRAGSNELLLTSVIR